MIPIQFDGKMGNPRFRDKCGFNTASHVRDIVYPNILKLIKKGLGLCVVILALGRSVSIIQLWKVWNGPSIVCNGGCTTVKEMGYGKLPLNTPLGLICGSEDFFSSKNPSHVQKLFCD